MKLVSTVFFLIPGSIKMPTICCVPYCRETNACFSFPSDPHLAEKWCQWIRQSFPEASFVQRPSHKVCEAHFHTDDVLKFARPDGTPTCRRLKDYTMPCYPGRRPTEPLDEIIEPLDGSKSVVPEAEASTEVLL